MKKFSRLLLISLLVLCVVVGVLAVFIYRQLDKETIKLGETEGELAFMSDRDGDWDIYLLDKDGELHNLSEESPAHEYLPSFTFSGEQLSLYTSSPGSMSPAIVNVDGSDFKVQSVIEAMMSVLAEGNVDWNPVWAPGGQQMAWTKVVPGIPPKVDLFVADADGNNRRQITDNSATEYTYSWSPDGKQIVFVSDSSGNKNTYVIDLEEGTTSRITEHDGQDYQCSWSMDGSQILVFSSEDAPLLKGEISLLVMTADGSDEHLLSDDDIFKGNMVYSPYGGQVAYMSNEDGYWHIYVMDADGSNAQRLTDGDSNNLFPVWRPVPAAEQEEE